MSATKTRPGRPSLTAAGVGAQKSRIAAVAERLFREEGYEAVSMRRLAAEAGCAPMTLYAYFESKAAILQTIWSAFFAELFEALEDQATSIGDPRERLGAISRSYAAYWIDNPDRYRMVYMTPGVASEDVGGFVRSSGAADRFQIFVRALLAIDPSLDDQTVKVRAEVLVSALQGIAYNQITTSAYPWEPTRVLVDTLVERLI